MNAAAARRRVFWWGLAPGGCRAALRGAAASLRPRGLRKARLRSPAFSPRFLHTHKVTTVLLSFSYGEWNFGLLCASFVVGEGAGRGGVVILGEKYVRGHFRLRASLWRSSEGTGGVLGQINVREDRCARPDSRFQSRRGGRQSLKRRNTFVETARGRGAAHESTNESRQGHAAAGAHARAHTPTGEWSACRSGAPQHERGQRSTLSKRTLTRWRRS